MTASSKDTTNQLAMACRVIAHQSQATGLAGQVTARDVAEPATFWTETFGLAVEEATRENLIRVNGEIEVVEGAGAANPANRFHSWVYRARPDVHAIVHTHAPHTSALSMLKEPLAIAHMDAMALFGDVAWLPRWPGVPFGDAEGRVITDALGEKSAVLLANHGLLTVGSTIEEATVLAVTFEHAARLHLLARSVGEINEVGAALGDEARGHARSALFVNGQFQYWVRRLPADQKAWLGG